MAIRMTFPDDVNPDPEATYSRSMLDAFPFDPHLSATARRLPAKKHLGLWLVTALFVALAIVLTGCGSAEAQEPSASPSELRRIAAEAWNCPGMHAVWLDETTVQCLNYLP